MLEHDEVVRLYGPWAHRTPQDAAGLLAGYPGVWWVSGGWAVEAFTGTHREHGDLDVGVPVADVPLLREHLSGRLDVWSACSGSLRPLVVREEGIPPGCGNLWLRACGAAPWEYDVTLTTTRGTEWVYRHDARITAPLADVLWEQDGVTYLRPEVQLLHKAPGLRAKDQADFDAAWPLLDAGARGWLRDALAVARPGHPWLDRG